jgi:hypothetical protein
MHNNCCALFKTNWIYMYLTIGRQTSRHDNITGFKAERESDRIEVEHKVSNELIEYIIAHVHLLLCVLKNRKYTIGNWY